MIKGQSTGSRITIFAPRAGKYLLKSLLFLRFAVLPLLALYIMVQVLDAYVDNVGGAAPGGRSIERIYDVPAAAANPAATPSPVPVPRIAAGRFEWMAFHLTALILYPAIAVLALLLMYRHLGRLRFGLYLVLGFALGGYWAIKSVGDAEKMETATRLLLLPTRDHALSFYDQAFKTSAWNGVRWDYGVALVVTVLVVIAAASIMHGVAPRRRLSVRRLESKRRDLRIILILASILMTFIAFYVGEWLAWPARLGDPAAAEFLSASRGLRVFFGTGYTLALLGFAIPAVIALSRAIQHAREAGPKGAEPDEKFLHQFVFSREEATILASVLVPVLTTIIGAAIAA